MYSLNIPYRSFSMKKREKSSEKSLDKLNPNKNESLISINQNLEVAEFNPFGFSKTKENQSSMCLPRDSIATASIVPQYRDQMRNNQILNTSITATDVSTKVTAPTTINKNNVNANNSNDGTNGEVLSRIKVNLGLKTNAPNKELMNLLSDILKEKEKMARFVGQLQNVALEFTSPGYFREKIPGPKSLWRWLKRFFNDYMVCKTKVMPKSDEES